MSRIAVSEIFGPTIQGEGPEIGRPCTFLRLMGCNLACSWCDTAYTWDSTRFDLSRERTMMDHGQVADRLAEIGVPKVIVSGGEPLLQADRLVPLFRIWGPHHFTFETAGTIPPLEDLGGCFYVVSPKLAHSGNPRGKRWEPDALFALRDTGRVLGWKFVAQHPEDLDEVDAIVKTIGIYPREVWIMPEGTRSEILRDRLPHLIPAALRRGYSISPRLHIDAWGTERGH